MKKSLFCAVAVLFFFALSIFTAHEAEAVPAFARQTGLACNTCHFQHFPALNSFGRAFKDGGYTQVGGQSLLEGDLLSVPVVLNASLVTKIRYQKRNGDGETGSAVNLNKGEIQFPDEAALLIGGRAGEHIGFLLEASLIDSPNFASYKMPIVFNVAETNLSAIPFTTDAAGAAYGYELLNTGAVRMIRVLEHRSEISGQQYIGTSGAATGIAFVASRPIGYINYTAYYPEHGTAAAGPLLNYLRVAATPQVGDWDLGGGFQLWNGTSKMNDEGAVTENKADAWAIDAQAQGAIGDYPVGVYVTYASAASSDAGDTANMFNSSTVDDESALTLLGEIGVLPGRLTLAAGYRIGKKPGSSGQLDDDAATVGAVYNALQNVQLQFNHTIYSGDVTTDATGDQLTTVMVFAAF
ncbi:MAG: hypothetical protein A2X93_08845 [Deltaproteobacteria bacterium GWC2_56_8]|nr:MAG: hypothetical protein A2X99_07290 [Deltaproteobacteria bacterium GWB2_55_19]OGP33131.1 MAG: hypothetical protein A2X93_08845 [Deltaproteobacteria bacterium GWC2_56_8]HAO92336.1 hypothetical protein [Deltaproteobacteria bacterium]